MLKIPRVIYLFSALVFIIPVFKGNFSDSYQMVFYSLLGCIISFFLISVLSSVYRPVNVFTLFLSATTLFYFFYMANFVVDEGNSYANTKIKNLTIIFIVYFIVLPSALREANLFKFEMYLLFFSFITSIYLLGTYDPERFRANALEANPIWMARICGVSVLIGMVVLFSQLTGIKRSKTYFIILLGIVFISLLALISTGSKGPIFSLIISIIVFFIIKNKFNIKATVAIFFIAITVIYLASLTLDDSIMERFSFESLEEKTIKSTRLELYFLALSLIWENPFGIGVGGFYNYSPASYTYPHNLILEIFCEFGVLAGIAFLILLAMVFAKAIYLSKKINTAWIDILLVLFLFSFFNSMFSGDISSPKMLYFTISLILNIQGSRYLHNK